MEKFNNILFTLSILLMTYSCNQTTNKVKITGDLMQWHKITLTADGPRASEQDTNYNPFTDYRMTAVFTHESGSPVYESPGYFAADGNAAETSAIAGNKWRVHIAPDQTGKWHYSITIKKGKNAAIDNQAAAASEVVFLAEGSFEVLPTDKTGHDFRGKGRLDYVGKRYLQFAGNKEFFLKAGADAPENLLAYTDFDGTYSYKTAGEHRNNEAATANLKTWQPHVRDWRPGDPTWKDGRGKGLIGALNYLSGKGCNAFSFLTYNAGGDGDDVWPFTERNDKFHYDCSKLDQWQIIFDHAQQMGLYLHFKLQETENDDNFRGEPTNVPTSLDGGELGPERKLYLRELIARFGYELALNWNLGEENTQTPEQQRAMADYIYNIDPYHHHIVIHTYPDWQDRVYDKLIGDQSRLTGASLQNGWDVDHQRVLHWIKTSVETGKPWVVANDEQNPANTGVPPDPGYEGFSGSTKPEEGSDSYTIDDIRKYTLWGTLMAGGAGVEYYFGYSLPQNDLNCQDWRSRDKSWTYCSIALEFFKNNNIPFQEMYCADSLVGNPQHDNSKYCLAKPEVIYVIYLPAGGSANLDLGKDSGNYAVEWYNPRKGGALQQGSIKNIQGPGAHSLGNAPEDESADWVILVKK